MKIVALVLVSLLAGTCAPQSEIDGKWATVGASKLRSLHLKIHKDRWDCDLVDTSKRPPAPVEGATFELELQVRRNKVSGSVTEYFWGDACGFANYTKQESKIEKGTILEDRFTFTTTTTVSDIEISTRWEGVLISAGALRVSRFNAAGRLISPEFELGRFK